MGAAGVHPGPFHAANWWLRGGTKDRFGDDWPCHAPVHATAVWSAPLTVDVHGSLNGFAPQHQTSVRKVSSRSRGGHLHSLSCAWSFCALLLLHRGSRAQQLGGVVGAVASGSGTVQSGDALSILVG